MSLNHQSFIMPNAPLTAAQIHEMLKNPLNPLTQDYLAACERAALKHLIDDKRFEEQIRLHALKERQEEEIATAAEEEKEAKLEAAREAAEIQKNKETVFISHPPYTQPTNVPAMMDTLVLEIGKLQHIEDNIDALDKAEQTLAQYKKEQVDQVERMVNQTYRIPADTKFMSTDIDGNGKPIEVTLPKAVEFKLDENTRKELLEKAKKSAAPVTMLEQLPKSHPLRSRVEEEIEKTMADVNKAEQSEEERIHARIEATQQAYQQANVFKQQATNFYINHFVRLAYELYQANHQSFSDYKIGPIAIRRYLEKNAVFQLDPASMMMNLNSLNRMTLEQTLFKPFWQRQRQQSQDMVATLLQGLNPHLNQTQEYASFYDSLYSANNRNLFFAPRPSVGRVVRIEELPDEEQTNSNKRSTRMR